MHNHARLAGLLITLSLLTTGALDLPASAQSRSLGGKRQALENKIDATKKRLATLEARADAQRGKLSASQRLLRDAQQELAVASQRLSRTRSELAVVRKEHKAASDRHLVQKKRMEARVVAQFEAGNPSYLEVVLDATSFADFTERAEMTEVIAERDQGFLQQLLATRQALAKQKAVLQEKTQREAEARDAVARQRTEVAIKTELTLGQLKGTNAARARAERELAAFQEASSAIAAQMQHVQQGGVSAGAYGGSWGGSFLRPCDGPITSGFGWRIHPITGRNSFHEGVDIGCGGGTPIRAADKGRVIMAGWYGPYGQAVMIDHGSGVSTLYGHTERGSLRVSVGDTVQRGQIIASVDSTGWSTGDHLHFGVYRNGSPVPPF